MSMEAIAALLGHRSLDMTRRYARISNRVVANEYNAGSERRSTTAPGQRMVPATGGAGLPLRVDLRDLHPLRHLAGRPADHHLTAIT